MKPIIYFIILLLIAVNVAVADDFLELREYRNRLCYDGDTCYVVAKILPENLRNMSIRILGIDTPEIRADCTEEKDLALQGRAFANDMFRNADTIEFRNLKWDKYGGRILADVYIDGMSYKHEIIEAGLAREYDGGKKLGWCD
jgi:endonuclease YncB( thermonuclease family)